MSEAAAPPHDDEGMMSEAAALTQDKGMMSAAAAPKGEDPLLSHQ